MMGNSLGSQKIRLHGEGFFLLFHDFIYYLAALSLPLWCLGRRPRRRPRFLAVVLRTRRPPSASGCIWRRSLPATSRRACPRASGAAGADPRQRRPVVVAVAVVVAFAVAIPSQRMTAPPATSIGPELRDAPSRCPQRRAARSSSVRPPNECTPTTIHVRSSRIDGQWRRAG